MTDLLLCLAGLAGVLAPSLLFAFWCGWDTAMDREALRQKLITGIDAILEAPWVISHWISEDNKRLLRAQRTYWQQASDTELDRALALYQQEP